jgi:multiple sugar transport system permease protein
MKSLRWLLYALLTGWAILSLLPLYWMFVTAFKQQQMVMQMPPQFWPDPATIANFRQLFNTTPIVRWTINTLIYAGFSTLFNLFWCALMGYTLAKKRFPGRMVIFWSIVSTMMVPLQVYLVPLFLLAIEFNLRDSQTGLILPFLFSPVGAFLLKQFMQTLPSELLDAGRIDGCSEFGVFWRIVLPLATPGLAVYGIFSFMSYWNDFIWPLIVINTREMHVLQVGLATVQNRFTTDFGLQMAGAAIAAIPMLLIFLFFSKYFLQGITVGALKG